MTSLSWNCQGVRGHLTIRRIEELCRVHSPDFLFLIETKTSTEMVADLQSSLGYDHHYLVHPVGLSDGLALFWRDSYKVEILSSCNRLVDTKISVGSVSYFSTFVYGDPRAQRRQEVWDMITQISMNRDAAWFLTGDFNELMNNSEKLGGVNRPESSFFAFRAFVRNCRIKEIPSSGNQLSWAGMREIMVNGEKQNAWIQCRLDRAFGNAEWYRLFPRTSSEYLERLGSDHRPIITRLAGSYSGRTGRFIFDKRWCSNPEVRNIIRNVWTLQQQQGRRSVSDCISACRKELAKWKRKGLSNSHERLRRLRVDHDKESSKFQPNMAHLRFLKEEITKAFKEEEVYWKQKSGNRWLREGDQNTKVFHGWARSRRMKTRIVSLKDRNDTEHFSEESKGDIAVDYFQRLFTSSNPQTASAFLSGFQPRVTQRMNIDLTKPITDGEIRKAVKSIKGDSSPGADGMTGHFFHKYWDIMECQVIAEVRLFFTAGRLPHDWNFTQICLLPKVKNPNLMTDLRPSAVPSLLVA